MRIKITGPNIYGKGGMVPIGTEFEVDEIPRGWGPRCVVLGKPEPESDVEDKNALVKRAKELGVRANLGWGVKKLQEVIAKKLEEDEAED